MSRVHDYQVSVQWTGNQGSGTSGYRDFARDHEVRSAAAEVLLGSSDPAFRGDAARWNPEQLLTASLSQCHMLWYLHLCAEAGVVVTSYLDNAHGTLLEDADGGQFTEVVLRPEVGVTAPEMVERATALHHDAHRFCFIASSVNFEVLCEPVIVVRP